MGDVIDSSNSLIDREVERARRTLAAMVRLQGITLQDLDRRTGHQRGYYSQILGGRLALRFRHVIEALDALGIDRRFFFQMVYPSAADLAQGGELFRLLGYPAEPAPASESAATIQPVPAKTARSGKSGPGKTAPTAAPDTAKKPKRS